MNSDLEFIHFLEGPGLQTGSLRVTLGADARDIEGLLSRFSVVFVVACRQFPELTFAGGLIGGISATGLGHSLRSALMRLAGEGAEILAVSEPSSHRSETPDHTTHSYPEMFRHEPDGGWVDAGHLLSGSKISVPSALAHRNPALLKPVSTGMGAGLTKDEATLHGINELIEREAVNAFWKGKIAARIHPKPRGILGPILFDLSAACPIPVIFAAMNGPLGFAFGAAARLGFDEAIQAAKRELYQSIIGQHFITFKRGSETGQVLSLEEQHVVDLAENIELAAIAKLFSINHTRAPLPSTSCLNSLGQALHDRNIDIHVIELGKIENFVVVKALEQGLSGNCTTQSISNADMVAATRQMAIL